MSRRRASSCLQLEELVKDATFVVLSMDDDDAYLSTLRPAKVDANDAVELVVERSEEVAQEPQRSVRDLRMSPAFRLAETVRAWHSVGRRQRPYNTRKPLDGIELEVGLVDNGTQSEKSLHALHLTGGISDQLFAVHEVDVRERKPAKPARHVTYVETDANSSPRCVHLACTCLVGCPTVYSMSAYRRLYYHQITIEYQSN